jgi:branched-chain amino acid transport system substrate-binding protein
VRKRSIKLIAGIAALGLVVAACAEDDSSSSGTDAGTAASGTDAPAGTEAPAGTDAPDGTEAPAGTDAPGDTEAPAAGEFSDEELLQWAVDYTGATVGEATGDPFKIGYVNQEAFFPENSVGIKAAIEFINTELGGFGGRPGELVTCEVLTDEDGTKCGTEMLNNDEVSFVLTGTLLNGNQQLYDVLLDKKPVIIGNAVTNPDFLTTAGVGYPTGSVGVIPGLAEYATTLLDPLPTSAAVVYGGNAAGQTAFASLLKPVFDARGIPVTAVEVADPGATSADVQAAMTAAGAATADVFIPLVTLGSCIATYDAIKQLGIDPVVVTTGLCFGTGMTDHLAELGEDGQVPNNWYFGGYGYSYFLPDLESGMATYLAKVKEYADVPAGTTIEFTGFSGPSFGNVMTIAKFANELGGEVDSASMKEKIFGFKGPAMLQAGTLSCGTTALFGITFPAVCGNEMGIEQYVDGEWVSIADALNDKPIDVTKIGT